MRRRAVQHACAILALAGSLAAAPAGAAAEGAQRLRLQRLQGDVVQSKNEIDALVEELRAVLAASRLACLEARAQGRAADPARCGRVEEKISEGQILLDLGEPDRAAIVLYNAYETPGFERSVLYEEGVSSLAEALYRSGNFVGARTYYRLLLQRGAQAYAELAIQRLIDVADKLGDDSDLESFFDAYVKMTGGASLRPEVAYVRAKSLLRAGRGAEAVPVLDGVPRNHALWLRAQYLLGVAALLPGGEAAMRAAVPHFARVLAQEPRDAGEAEVRELAALALGRLHYELGDLVASIDAYQNIPRESDHFHDMLFEVAWAFIKRGQLLHDEPDKAQAEFRKALQALELIVAPGSRLEPEIAILRGNLQLRLGETAQAQTAFEDVIGRYQATEQQLEVLMSERGDAGRLLEDILAADDKSLNVTTLLPPLAARWAQGQEEIDEALRVYKDLRLSKAELAATRQVIAKLRSALSAPNRVELLPAFGEIHARGLVTRDRLLGQRAELIRLQAEALGASSIPGYAEAVARRQALEQKFAAIPKTAQGLTERMNRIAGRIEQLEREVFKLSLAIDEATAQIRAMVLWVRDSQETRKLEPHDVARMQEDLTLAQREVEYLRDEQRALGELLRQERQQLTVSGGAGAQEAQIRAELDRALAEEARLLAAGRVSAGDRPLLGELDALALQLEGLIEQIERFRTSLDGHVDSYVQHLQEQIDREERLLDAHERETLRYQNEAGDVAASAAAQALRGVRDDFHDFVLRADVGLIDMAWQAKKDKSDEISRLVKRQRAELKALDVEFGEVLQGDGE